MTEVNYNGKEELLMSDYEGISDSDLSSKYANTDFDITDAPSTYITNTQMTYALTCKRLFPEGDTYICNDEGTYKKGHIYQIKVDGETKSWEDVTPSAGGSSAQSYLHSVSVKGSASNKRVAVYFNKLSGISTAATDLASLQELIGEDVIVASGYNAGTATISTGSIKINQSTQFPAMTISKTTLTFNSLMPAGTADVSINLADITSLVITDTLTPISVSSSVQTYKTLFGNQSITGSGNIDLYRHNIMIDVTGGSGEPTVKMLLTLLSSNNVGIDSMTDFNTMLTSKFPEGSAILNSCSGSVDLTDGTSEPIIGFYYLKNNGLVSAVYVKTTKTAYNLYSMTGTKTFKDDMTTV